MNIRKVKIDRIKLITEMARANMTSTALAEKTGIGRITIGRLRSGAITECSKSIAFCIAAGLEIDIAAIAAEETT